MSWFKKYNEVSCIPIQAGTGFRMNIEEDDITEEERKDEEREVAYDHLTDSQESDLRRPRPLTR